jgi:transcriptional regulator with XRE-family HTH domain
MDASTLGERIRNVRRRRGLTQGELATAARVSLSLVKKLEQDTITDLRLETLHKFAIVLKVPTSHLAAGPDARSAEEADVSAWEPVRQALSGEHAEDPPDGEPTVASVRDAFGTAVADVQDNRYADLRVMLPALLRDADDLVTASASGGNGGCPSRPVAEPTARRVHARPDPPVQRRRTGDPACRRRRTHRDGCRRLEVVDTSKLVMRFRLPSPAPQVNQPFSERFRFLRADARAICGPVDFFESLFE